MILPKSYTFLSLADKRFNLTQHYENHYLKYIDQINQLVSNIGNLNNKSTTELIIDAKLYGTIYNNACQIYNHDFFFEQFIEEEWSKDKTVLEEFLSKHELDFEMFTNIILDKCLKFFGSGYLWVYLDELSILQIETGTNAENLVKRNRCIPILTIDLWEHSYYTNYLSDKENYVKEVLELMNWKIINDRIISIN